MNANSSECQMSFFMATQVSACYETFRKVHRGLSESHSAFLHFTHTEMVRAEVWSQNLKRECITNNWGGDGVSFKLKHDFATKTKKCFVW